jgi:hypothetical protein
MAITTIVCGPTTTQSPWLDLACSRLCDRVRLKWKLWSPVVAIAFDDDVGRPGQRLHVGIGEREPPWLGRGTPASDVGVTRLVNRTNNLEIPAGGAWTRAERFTARAASASVALARWKGRAWLRHAER